MKIIYKVLYPMGYEEHEVEDKFPTSLPFVEIKPLEGLKNEQTQFFNFVENKWEEAVTQDYSKKLALLENLSLGLQASNSELEQANEQLTKKADNFAQISAKSMLAINQLTNQVKEINEKLAEGVE
ncbi:TPA: hypothetical protein RD623_001733 [Enterococcus faecalis]|uniref:hypothetical protein n=1 Tax=Enterococcus faecalis TaxID=1351 RepID=UPI000CF33E35|nr:hypothetical protein [Enterococcus faecalis]MCL4593433.1 hypothetical protein [Enterococcus faecalis]NSM42230.1 hypothetical protein [Enterococcus faecalis]PQG91710.1 hypothetical protein CUS23_04605 [Enterococcus faecalis]HCW2819738.1 hypothetical protein [Enterococcus faecalis]HDT7983089.1 hypothetical protein [Enterococcus faecalis]